MGSSPWHIGIVTNKISPKTNNPLIVHNIGNIINVPKLKREYKDYIFLEDNCEGFLGKYEEKNTGNDEVVQSSGGNMEQGETHSSTRQVNDRKKN